MNYTVILIGANNSILTDGAGVFIGKRFFAGALTGACRFEPRFLAGNSRILFFQNEFSKRR
jgi:hypothetical protein